MTTGKLFFPGKNIQELKHNIINYNHLPINTGHPITNVIVESCLSNYKNLPNIDLICSLLEKIKNPLFKVNYSSSVVS